MTAPDTADLNVRAAELWPDRWARMETLTGKKRANARRALREHAETHDKMAALPTHARCRTCKHLIASPVGAACDLDSDFHGYTKVLADHVCARWAAKESQA